DDHDVEARVLVMALDLQQAEELVHAGRHGQLLGRDAVDPALDEHLAEPLLHGAPVALELVLADTCCANNRSPTCSADAPSDASSASPRLCAGSVDITTVVRPAAAQRRAVAAATEVLPTPPL